MKAQITSTDRVVEMKDSEGKPFRARVWEGVSDGGVGFTAYIAVVQVRTGDDHAVFQRELTEHVQPRPETARAIDMRFVL